MKQLAVVPYHPLEISGLPFQGGQFFPQVLILSLQFFESFSPVVLLCLAHNASPFQSRRCGDFIGKDRLNFNAVILSVRTDTDAETTYEIWNGRSAKGFMFLIDGFGDTLVQNYVKMDLMLMDIYRIIPPADLTI